MRAVLRFDVECTRWGCSLLRHVVADRVPVRVFGRDVEYKWIVAAELVSALSLDILDLLDILDIRDIRDILDTTIVNVALPTLGRELGADLTEWVVIGYTQPRSVHPRSRPAQRSIRQQAGLPVRTGDLRHRLGAVWCRSEHRATDRIPGGPGHWWRHAHAGRARHAVPSVPTG